MDKNSADFLWKLGLDTIRELETEQGILASSREEIYGCIFGRDSLITSLKLIKAYSMTGEGYFLDLTKKILLNLVKLQGKGVNIESGEEPGKCIHEYRPSQHERLTKNLEKPWYLYPDNIMRNYDSVDATPLLLIALYRYLQKSKDDLFEENVLSAVKLALNWLVNYGDSNGDGLIDFKYNTDRKSGGLINQNWMDSSESMFHEDDGEIIYPIAPVEVQAYSYLALRLWASYFFENENIFSLELSDKADNLKRVFNEKFVIFENQSFTLASGIDGAGKIIAAQRSSAGHVLWAGRNNIDDGISDSILEDRYISLLVNRLMEPDIFVKAGLRTLSAKSHKFNPKSYHNGSIWPHDNGLIAEGMENFGYFDEARRIREAVLMAIHHFKTPVELFVFSDGNYMEYCSDLGQTACKRQAWSAASILTSIIGLKGKVLIDNIISG